MSENRSRIEAAPKGAVLKFAEPAVRSRMQAEELLSEIDKLALLLHEVRKQTDKIEAAADAIGDAILSRLQNGLESASLGASRPSLRRTAPRLRTLPARSAQPRAGDLL